MTLFAEALPFAVLKTTPKGIVQVNSDTDIVIKDEAIDDDDVGQCKESPTKTSVELVANCSRLEK